MTAISFYTLFVIVVTTLLVLVEADLHRGGILGFGGGDPHVTTFHGERYEFHRPGSFVLLSNPDYADGLGLEIHVKSKVNNWWSFIESAALRIGDETLQVCGGVEHARYWINGEEGFSELEPGEGMRIWLKQERVEVHIRQVNSKQLQVRVDLGNDEGIVLETFREFVRVDVQANDSAAQGGLANSEGLMGSYPSGSDKTPVITNPGYVAQLWQLQEETL